MVSIRDVALLQYHCFIVCLLRANRVIGQHSYSMNGGKKLEGRETRRFCRDERQREGRESHYEGGHPEALFLEICWEFSVVSMSR